nr:amino acid permease [Nocardioidaceae bacterium]
MASKSSPPSTPSRSTGQSDADRLRELGYEQELHRSMSGFSNFAVSFSIISVLAGCITSYLIAMNAGGPVAISIGWPVVGIFVLLVSMAMAEVCSVYP